MKLELTKQEIKNLTETMEEVIADTIENITSEDSLYEYVIDGLKKSLTKEIGEMLSKKIAEKLEKYLNDDEFLEKLTKKIISENIKNKLLK